MLYDKLLRNVAGLWGGIVQGDTEICLKYVFLDCENGRISVENLNYIYHR